MVFLRRTQEKTYLVEEDRAMGRAGVEPQSAVCRSAWEIDRWGTAVTNRDWRQSDYIFKLEKRLNVTVEQGARDMMQGTPSNHRGLSPRVELVAVHHSGRQQNKTLPDVLAEVRTDGGCEEIPPETLLAACAEVARQFANRTEFTHAVLFHKPLHVGRDPSLLYFRRREKGVVILGHTHKAGLWHLPQVLFVFALPPRRR